jgi:hypothetical protein
LDDDYPDLDKKKISHGLIHLGLKGSSVFKTVGGLKLKAIADRPANGNLVVSVEPEYKWSNKNATFEGKFASDRKFESTLSVTDLGTKGTKVYAKEMMEKHDITLEGGVEYKDKNVAINGRVTYPLKDQNVKGYFAGVAKQGEFSVGGDGEYIADGGVANWSVKVQKDFDKSSLCFFSNNVLIPKKKEDGTKSEIGFGYSQVVNDSLKGALDFKLESNEDTTTRFGYDYQLDASTNLKSRVSIKSKHNIRAAFVYKQKILNTKVAFGADLDLKHITGLDSTNDNRFSVSLSYGDD